MKKALLPIHVLHLVVMTGLSLIWWVTGLFWVILDTLTWWVSEEIFFKVAVWLAKETERAGENIDKLWD